MMLANFFYLTDSFLYIVSNLFILSCFVWFLGTCKFCCVCFRHGLFSHYYEYFRMTCFSSMPPLIIFHSQVKSQAWSAPRPVPLSPPLPFNFFQNGRLNLLVAASSPSASSLIVENLLVVDPFRTGIIIRAVVDLLIVRVGM